MRHCRLGLLLLIGISTTLTPAAICDGVSSASGTALASVRIATGLDKPCVVTSPPGDTHRLFIVEQDGRIRIVKDGVLLPTAYLDVSGITRSPLDAGGDNEEGLLGLAFSPSYSSDGYFFIYHTDNTGGANLIARYHVSANPDVADPASRALILTVPHPSFGNHNGGDIHFGPGDGYLYIGTGDGGDACDPGGSGGNAQNTNDLKGKLLRIDVVPPPTSQPYRIPPGQPGFSKPEIFSIGLRNPWRYSFDRQTHALYIGDVGQNTWEEVNYVPAGAGSGANFGWQNYEGFDCPAPSCDATCTSLAARISPVKVYSHGQGCSITGGYVYRGCRMPALAAQGRYLYADYCVASVQSFVISGGAVTSELTLTSQLSPSIGGATISEIASWGEDAQGELYIVARGGDVFKLVPLLRNMEVSGTASPGAASPAPFRLGDSGWGWEDLAASSSMPIEFYRVYRHSGNGSGTFNCVYKTPTVAPPARPAPGWPGGDPAVPGVGALFSYVVTAVRTSSPADESSPGRASNGAARSLGSTVCP